MAQQTTLLRQQSVIRLIIHHLHHLWAPKVSIIGSIQQTISRALREDNHTHGNGDLRAVDNCVSIRPAAIGMASAFGSWFEGITHWWFSLCLYILPLI